MRHIMPIIACIVLVSTLGIFAAAPPTQPVGKYHSLIDDLRTGDAAKVDAAIAAIAKMPPTGHIPDAFWKNWLPQLIRIKRYDDAAEIAQSGILNTPLPGGAGPMCLYRTKALVALNKPAEALVAAKSYYNVCDLKDTAAAVKLVSDCLAAARPEDATIARRFQDEQAAASAGTAPSGTPILQSVKIDGAVYHDAIESWSGKTSRFSDRVSYGNLLLIADRASEAEVVFRRLFQIAKTQAELAGATEGLARTLRAEDGNVGRANAWLGSLQQGK